MALSSRSIAKAIQERTSSMDQVYPNARPARVVTNYGNGMFKLDVPGEGIRDKIPSMDPNNARRFIQAEDMVSTGFLSRSKKRMFVIGLYGASGEIEPPPETPTLYWPMWRQSGKRHAMGNSTLTASTMAAVQVVTTDRILRSLVAGGSLVLASDRDGGVRGYRLDGTLAFEAWGGGANAYWMVYDIARVRLYVVNGSNGLTYAYDLTEPVPTPMEQSRLLSQGNWTGATAHEPMLIGDRLWIVNAGSVASWTLSGASVDDLADGSVPTVTAAWNEWSQADNLPNSVPPNGYPIFPWRTPFFGREASYSAYPLALVTDVGHVILNGYDQAFIDRVKDERDTNPRNYEDLTPRNYGLISMRSEAFAIDPVAGSRVWTLGGWELQGSNKLRGYTPVLAERDRVLLHFEQKEFATRQFYHFVATQGMDDYIAALPYVAPSIDTQGIWHEPRWQNDVPAPSWAYSRGAIDSGSGYAGGVTLAEVRTYLTPAVSAPITRDYQSKHSHGLALRSALAGSQVAELEWPVDQQAIVTLDTGDPTCAPHADPDPISGLTPPARPMMEGTYRLVQVTAGVGVAASLEGLLNLLPGEFVASYVAVERYTGDAWIGDDGATHSTFYRAHAWYGGTVDEFGHSNAGAAPMISMSYTDPEGRWSHETVSVEYHAWVGMAVTIMVEVTDPTYGYDPENAVSDGDTIYLLPRRVPAYYDPTPKAHIWCPPGTRRPPFSTVPTTGFQIDGYSFGFSQGNFHWVYYLSPGRTGYENWSPDGIGLAHTTEWNKFLNPSWDWATFWAQGQYRYLDSPGATRAFYQSFVSFVDTPRFGYWPDGVTVDYLNPPTFRGSGTYENGDLPEGGIWLPGYGPDDLPPHKPDDQVMHGVLLALDAKTLATKWERDFGNVAHVVTPLAVIAAGFLWLFMAAKVYQLNRTDGSTVAVIDVPQVATWTEVNFIPVDGRLAIAGSGPSSRGMVYVT